MQKLEELSPDELIALARECLLRVRGSNELAFEESRDDDDNLVHVYRSSDSGREFRLVARLDSDEDSVSSLGNIDLRAELDNRVGYIELVHETEEPDSDWLAEVGPQLFVSAHDAETREWMRDAVTRIGDQLGSRVAGFLRAFDQYSLAIGSSELRVEMIADMSWDEEDWSEGPRELSAHIEALDAIAAVIEAQLPDAYVACEFCGGRFNVAGTQRCPHCGAAP